MDYRATESHDTGSLRTGALRLQVGDLVEIEDEGKLRRVTYVMGSDQKGWYACFKGQGAVPRGSLRWRRMSAGSVPAATSAHSEASTGPSAEEPASGTVPDAASEASGFSSTSIEFPSLPHVDGTVLISAFDSAWTRTNRGGLTLVAFEPGGARCVQPPTPCSFDEAQQLIEQAVADLGPRLHILPIDQPLVVPNDHGRRLCEVAVAPLIGRYGGGVQPANRSRTGMFDFPGAPIYGFLSAMGGTLNPDPRPRPQTGTWCFEVYPALATLGLFPALFERGRLPKYNPQRRATFRLSDWQALCVAVARALRHYEIEALAVWCDEAANNGRPNKALQDKLDSLLCLLCGIVHWAGAGSASLVIGDIDLGYIVTPAHPAMQAALLSDATMAACPMTPLRR